MKTIVVATDGSKHARAALEMAVELAGETGASLCCVSVDDSLATVGIDPEPGHVAQAAAQSARDQGLQAEAMTRVGPAAERILEVAEDCGADLIVVGSRGHGPLTSAILGSVSMGLIRGSRRPVLVVKSADV
jgi:nucleotide-binding universal stress UspA family protein